MGKAGRLDMSMKVYMEMQGYGFRPSAPMYVSMIESYVKAGKLDAAHRLWDEMKKAGFRPNFGLCTMIVVSHAKSRKLDIAMSNCASTAALQNALWGPSYYNPKTKMIVGKKGVAGLTKARPMFVQFVLEPLWQVYQAALEDGDNNKVVLEKVIKSFNLNVPPHELQNKDPKVVLQAVMSRWLPLFDAVLSMVVRCMPDPVAAQAYRITRLLPKRQVLSDGVDPNALAEAELVRKSVEACDSRPEAPCVAFVSKMFAVPMKVLPQRGLRGDIINNVSDEGELNECFLAFARIFSRVLYSGQKVYVLSALYDPLKGESMKKHIQEAEFRSLYLMMGQGLTHVASAHTRNLVAIRGLGQHILKSATLSSTKNCWPFSSMAFQVSPTLRVAIEPSYPADMGALTKGLRLLNRADPFVEVTVSAKGEHVLSAAGERPLREIVVDKLKNLKLFLKSSDCVKKKTPNERCTIKVRVIKLPPSLTKVLEENSGLLGEIIEGNAQTDKSLDTKISRIEEDENPTEALTKRFMDAGRSMNMVPRYQSGDQGRRLDPARKALKLPFEMIIEILSWLTVDALLRMKSVCKKWCAFIEDHHFIVKHMDRASPLPIKCQYSRRHDQVALLHSKNIRCMSRVAGLFVEKHHSLPVCSIRNPVIGHVLDLPNAHMDVCRMKCAFDSLTVMSIGQDGDWRALKHPNQGLLKKNGKWATRRQFFLTDEVHDGVYFCSEIITDGEDWCSEVQALDPWNECFITTTLPQGVFNGCKRHQPLLDDQVLIPVKADCDELKLRYKERLFYDMNNEMIKKVVYKWFDTDLLGFYKPSLVSLKGMRQDERVRHRWGLIRAVAMNLAVVCDYEITF
ncbi:unnamed protein product [Prunus armeniaca]|uniref:F-box domain-containing protein n=1 Tax=Prunus armeniaca TaxID=36596 RepID=A0A6J5WDT1_PRUAR|nr:unnamed protein product [Prunus armeniaca]